MKRVAGICLALILGVAMIAGLAQSAFAECAPNPKAEAEWQRFLTRHNGLRNHPEWLHNEGFMNQHPNMSKWLHDHPCVLADARRPGMWDNAGRWHDPAWWHQNDPDQFWAYHPEWAQGHPDWRNTNDGDWDDTHHWRDRQWWVEHHPDWVKEHHPHWYQKMEHHHDHNGDHDHHNGDHDHD